MRFAVLGGSGDMGRRAVRELALSAGVEVVTIAGRSRDAAERVRRQVMAAQGDGQPEGEERAEVRIARVDATDRKALVRLLREHDVAVGALGPFYLHEEALVQAAIQARRPYVSICDDADAVTRALAHDGQARAAGIPILTGLGWTPGLTNLLARRACQELATTHTIQIAWAGSAADSQGRAVILHTLHIFAGKATTFAGGVHRQVRAGSGGEEVVFPNPIGPVRVAHAGHPEPVTLPRYLPGLREVTLKGGLAEPLLHRLALLCGRLGLSGGHLRRTALAAGLRPLLPSLERISRAPAALAGAVVRALGTWEGHPAQVTYGAVGPMATLTSVPLALGALWLAQGRIPRRGVFAPEAEGGPDAKTFLSELAPRGVEVRRLDEIHG